MRLIEIPFVPSPAELPERARLLIRDAHQRIAEYDDQSPAQTPAFIPSDFDLAYRSLQTIQNDNLAPGHRFVEWGSGIGTVACLATLAGFDAVGIEIEQPLVDLAEQLADDHNIDVEFACGSYVPEGADVRVERMTGIVWLTTDGNDGYEELDLEADDFDVVYAYPWPGEEQVIFDLFKSIAAVGSLLLTYHGQDGMKLQRKVKR